MTFVAKLGGRPFLEPALRELARVHRVHEREREAEDVEAEVAQRAVPLGRRPVHALRRDQADELLCCGEDAVEPLRQGTRRELHGRGVGHAEQRRVGRRVPAVDRAVADGHRRDARHAEPRELGERGGLGLHVDGVELDPPRRQQLLRLGTGRSAGSVEETGSAHDVTSP